MAADVKVGSAAGITGPIEGLVPPILAGRNLAATHVNEQGGILGGRQLRARAGRLPVQSEGRGGRGHEARQRRAGGGDHRPELLRGHERHGPVGQHSGRRGDPVGHRDRADDLLPRGQRPRVPGRSLGRLPERRARAARLRPGPSQDRGHLRERRLQRGARRGVHRPPSSTLGGTITGKQAPRTGPAVVPLRALHPRPAAGRKRSRSSPTTGRAGSRSCATASRTPSSTSSWGRTA